jgi:SM-20-related protein
MPLSPTLNTEQWVHNIAQSGYILIEDFLAPDIIQNLAQQARDLHQQGAMPQASTGQSKHISSIRGDHIHWLEDSDAQASPALQKYFAAMQTIQQTLNRELFLGLFSLEAHLALYPSGTGYAKHLDQLQGKPDRKISSILYLNQDWQTSDGGALRLYLENDSFMDISPIAGRLVLFLSERFMHEVLPAQRERLSLTGWFKTRGAAF